MSLVGQFLPRGVRKRVKLLGGELRWRENLRRGIVCEARVPELLARS